MCVSSVEKAQEVRVEKSGLAPFSKTHSVRDELDNLSITGASLTICSLLTPLAALDEICCKYKAFLEVRAHKTGVLNRQVTFLRPENGKEASNQ